MGEGPVSVLETFFSPALNAALNGLSAFWLTAGFFFIRARRIPAHKFCMVAAFVTSILFLACYVVYHVKVGSRPFAGQGWIRPVYFTLLISHTLLAAMVVPLALVTIFRAIKKRFDQHRKTARWTLPVWLYVSVTGVVIYFMLR